LVSPLALGAVVGMGAVGGIVANIALTPLSSGAGLLQSYYYGSGLILGERMMYTFHWEKIKKRLDAGETFMSVLDDEMNKDITAIANLAFITMERTGKLFLDATAISLGKLIEDLLAAAIDPFFSGTPTSTTEVPPPTGEITPEGVVLTIEQIQAMTINEILFALQQTSIQYSSPTIQHMNTILADKQSQVVPPSTTIEDLRILLFEDEQKYLIWLLTLDLVAIRGGAFASDVDIQRKLEVNYGSTFDTRTLSSASDARLQEWRDALQANRQLFLKAKAGGDASALRNAQRLVNLSHTMIYVHQLIYSR